MITSQDRRLGVDQLKHHPFFYGVDWNAIRDIEAPFIPRLRSITDTSYFPTDDLTEVPEEPAGGDTTGANKDLAFLGWVPSLLHPPISTCNDIDPAADTHSNGSPSHLKHSKPRSPVHNQSRLRSHCRIHPSGPPSHRVDLRYSHIQSFRPYLHSLVTREFLRSRSG